MHPCTVRISFINAPTGEAFGVTVGLRLVTSSACSTTMETPPETWTIGQRRRIFRRVIGEASQLVHAEEDQDGGEGQESMLLGRDEVNLAEVPTRGAMAEGEAEGIARRQVLCAIRCAV